jgi:hypothetical protein
MLMYNSDSYTNTDNATSAIESLPYKHLGGGGRLTYTNDSRYIGEFSFGYMGSEAFPKKKPIWLLPGGIGRLDSV